MKNLVKTIKIGSVILLTTLTACKKNKDEVKPDPKPIITEELINYQMVVALRNPANDIPARLFHFTKSGSEVTATMDGVQSRRTRTIKVIDNRFIFDSDADGKIVYDFKFKRNDNGQIIMDVAKYQNLNDASLVIEAAVIWPSNFPDFKGKTFKGIGDNKYILKFTNDTWTFIPATNSVGTFYEIAKGAWKGRLDGHDYLGFSFYQDNDTQPSMALIRDGSKQMMPFQ